MTRQMRRILRIMFAVIGSLTALLFVVTEVGVLLVRFVYNPPGDLSFAVRGGFIYFGIALVSFFAVWRLRAPELHGPGNSADT
jgi:hypothetical protein